MAIPGVVSREQFVAIKACRSDRSACWNPLFASGPSLLYSLSRRHPRRNRPGTGNPVGTIHIIGAGLAGLTAALALSAGHRQVVLYERQRRAGGRVRSCFDSALGVELDNGIHMSFRGQRALGWFLREVDAEDRFVSPETDGFEFFDLVDDQRWVLRARDGAFPWWILDHARRVPGTGVADFVSLTRIALASSDITVTSCLGASAKSCRRFWEPFTVAALNTPPHRASARELWRAWRQCLVGLGRHKLGVQFARRSLRNSLSEPAVAALGRKGGVVRYGATVRAIQVRDGLVDSLGFDQGEVLLGPDDWVIAATTAGQLNALLPELSLPHEESSIVTAHFLLSGQALRTNQANPLRLLCLLDSRSEWLLVRGGVATLTVGAADDLVAESEAHLARRFWSHVSRGLGDTEAPMPPFRIIKERAGTFAHTPEQCARRAGVRSPWRNLLLAGDWTDTGTSATMEGAVRSGLDAARSILGRPVFEP